MSLPSLPLDVLLAVFRYLDVVNVIRIGMTCEDLYRATQDRPVWINQLDRLHREDPVLKPATPPLTSLSVQELKSFVTGRIKLRFRWDDDRNDLGFAAKGSVAIQKVRHLILLPGGKSLLAFDDRGGLALHRVELGDGHVSLPVVAHVESDKCLSFDPRKNTLITTTLPYPILVCARGNGVQVLRINHHKGEMSVETTLSLPGGPGSPKADGQGRVIGLLVQKLSGPLRVIIIHLDYLGAILELEILAPILSLANICIPTERLAIIHHTENILACKIPDFSSLSSGINRMDATQMGSWPGPQYHQMGRSLGTYLTSEALYDPLYARAFDVYYVHRGNTTLVTTITIPIDPGDSEPPPLKQRSTLIRHSVSHWQGSSPNKGLHYGKAHENDGVSFLVKPLKNLSSQDPSNFLRIFVSREEFKQVSKANMVMDEATGRVIVWGWDGEVEETRVFVGDLV